MGKTAENRSCMVTIEPCNMQLYDIFQLFEFPLSICTITNGYEEQHQILYRLIFKKMDLDPHPIHTH